MTKRVSIKGQGADIFFDEPNPPSSQRPETSSTDGKGTVGDRPLPSPESKPARKTSGKQASKQDSLQASQQASTSPPKTVLANLDSAGRRRLLDLIEREHRTHNTYRYHADELAAVRDIVYEMDVRRGVSITRNDVMRAALNWLIEDYKDQGEESFLVRLFKEGA